MCACVTAAMTADLVNSKLDFVLKFHKFNTTIKTNIIQRAFAQKRAKHMQATTWIVHIIREILF